VQDTATDPKPIFVDCFPLTAGPQNVPNPGQNGPVIRWWSSSPPPFGWFWKQLFDLSPEVTGQFEIVYIRWFYVMLFTQDVFSLSMFVLGKHILAKYVFFTHFLFYG